MSYVQGVAGSLASGLSGAAVEAEQACYLPLSSDGLPVIGRCVPGALGRDIVSCMEACHAFQGFTGVVLGVGSRVWGL